jgi:hypothetical protein
MRKHKRNLTREERLLRNEKIAYFFLVALWGAILAAALVSFIMEKIAAETETEVEATIVIDAPPTAGERAQVVPEAPTPIVVIEEPEVVAFDPVREDIPLDAEIQKLLYRACDKLGIEYELALAVIRQESNFQNIVGDNGNSIGYMQIQPRWHSDRMERHGVSDLADPEGNFLVGCDYLAEMLAEDRGIEWALMAYNGGPSYANEMAKAGNVSQYAQNVLNYRKEFKTEEK